MAGRPYFGRLEEVTVANYIEDVEDAPDTHTIVVHLYQPVCLKFQ